MKKKVKSSFGLLLKCVDIDYLCSRITVLNESDQYI